MKTECEDVKSLIFFLLIFWGGGGGAKTVYLIL